MLPWWSLSPGQTIATSQSNISQHCWLSICKLRPNDRNIVGGNMLHAFGHPVAMCCESKIELVSMPRRNIVGRTWPNDYNIMQHPQMLHEKFDQHPTYRNRVVKRIQHVRPKILWYVALECCDCLTRALNDEKGFWPQGETLKIKKQLII